MTSSINPDTVRFGVVIFPGSNCDHDAYSAAHLVLGESAEFVWHADTHLDNFDCVILPGGFSYGDYLRTGAIARFAPIMSAVREFAASGGLVLGICNGFQILTESHLLPGALVRNKNMRFLGQWVYIRVEQINTPFTSRYRSGQVLRVPVGHGDGNFFADPDTVQKIEKSGRVVFRYCDRAGSLSDESNPNGALGAIAGFMNENGTVLGMMPHPERAVEPILGSVDGRGVFESIRDHVLLQRKNRPTFAATA